MISCCIAQARNRYHIRVWWCRKEESNLRPTDYESMRPNTRMALNFNDSPIPAVYTRDSRTGGNPHNPIPERDMSHHCHWPTCNKPVPPKMWGCKRHWFKLPKRIRDRIWATYRPGQEINKNPSGKYMEAAFEARRWAEENPDI